MAAHPASSASWIPDHQSVIGYVGCDDRSRRYKCITPNRHPAHNGCISADCAAALQMSAFIKRMPINLRPWIGHICQKAGRSKEHVILDDYACINGDVVLHLHVVANDGSTVHADVLPNDAFLVATYTLGADNKPTAQNFLLPASTSILDDFFFIHREVLAWKYLASACKNEKGNLNCPHQKVQFGALNPHARTSMSVTIEFSGKDRVALGGAERELSKFVLSSEVGDWTFWLDDQFKLVRLRSDSGTEVIRD